MSCAINNYSVVALVEHQSQRSCAGRGGLTRPRRFFKVSRCLHEGASTHEKEAGQALIMIWPYHKKIGWSKVEGQIDRSNSSNG
ncbi:uncharacterized protein N7506_011297 [Penicillium brevicompactum]|uniref:uncharacterized protein n=1 Tax=Penicillium brevicompactum TaxID=5074 RepID=UPI0025413FCE|nr:uncharacterized protein N7506_011297 [Penicillium brevicompactum]KAJ5322167.1 hypothetical protein N7506_011297 [Penicillium brevicompactum]